MAAIINALFGTYPDPPAAETPAATVGAGPATTQTVIPSTGGSGESVHTSAVSDNVHVTSVVSSETQSTVQIQNQLKINALMAQLGTTHEQVDTYSRTRTAEINEQVQKAIADVLASTQVQQEGLLLDANRRHLAIDTDYKTQLQKAVEALDTVKAKTLAELEHELQAKQHAIMDSAKRQIDALNDQANAAKLNALREAQEQGKRDIHQITDQVAALGAEEASHCLQSSTTTVITSHAEAQGGNAKATHAQFEGVVAVCPPKEVVPVAQTAISTQNADVSVASTESTTASTTSTPPIQTTSNTIDSNAFGTVTGASDLTTTPASIIAESTATSTTATHAADSVNKTNNNVTF